MIDTLKYNYPDTLIDFLVNKRVAELIENYPNINKVQPIEKDSIRDIKQICSKNSYDLVIAVHPTFIIALSIFLSGVKFRLGTGYRWYSFLFNIRRYQHRKYSEKHELEYNLDLLKEINCKLQNDTMPQIQVSGETVSQLKSKTDSLGLDLNSGFIVIHPGSLGSAATWGNNNFIKLINLILEDKNIHNKIVLTGVNEENTLINSIIEHIIDKDKVLKITNLSLKEFAGLLKNAALCISNSTGPIHIAAAVGTFVIGFYPAKRQESAARWAPYTEKKKIFSSRLQNSEKHNLNDIDPVEVFSFIKSYLKV
jgi:heptosyltransferase-3